VRVALPVVPAAGDSARIACAQLIHVGLQRPIEELRGEGHHQDDQNRKAGHGHQGKRVERHLGRAGQGSRKRRWPQGGDVHSRRGDLLQQDAAARQQQECPQERREAPAATRRVAHAQTNQHQPDQAHRRRPRSQHGGEWAHVVEHDGDDSLAAPERPARRTRHNEDAPERGEQRQVVVHIGDGDATAGGAVGDRDREAEGVGADRDVGLRRRSVGAGRHVIGRTQVPDRRGEQVDRSAGGRAAGDGALRAHRCRGGGRGEQDGNHRQR